MMKRSAAHQSPSGNSKPPTSRRNTHKSSKENVAPPPDNVPSSPGAAKVKNPFPPRPPSSNPLKRKLEPVPETTSSSSSTSAESGVQVIVRMRPLNKDEKEGGMIAQKISDYCLSISGHTFTFDSISDANSTQHDIFELVGAPLVENCLAGFNSSVFAYGQTGSGKTYTMWGPANALSEKNICSDQQGLTPRVFQRLFARINEEQRRQADKQLNYQCRCSFLEIYNEQITDLLDPNQKNLHVREDVKSGVYVQNLREEYVLTMKDVMKLLVKGFSHRKTGATSINAESSRSHCVFTCILESRCKSNADGISSLKTSRINLVDLAGSERQKLTGAAGDRLKEAVNINRSLSQLGNLINVLAEASQTGKQRHIPYRDSRLTFLLQESLGGNAKLAMVCAVSPSLSCKNETLSTLRFAQRAKAIKNKAVVNEEMEDNVNHLREIIRQLKDDLSRAKENGSKATGWSPRKSMILLKSLIDPQTRFVDEDGDEEMEIDEEAVERLCDEVGAAAEAKHKTIDILDSGGHIAMHDRIEDSSDLSIASSETSPFSFHKPAESESEKVDIGVQTYPGEDEMIQKNADAFVCVNCKKKRARIELKDADECSNIEPRVPNAMEKDLTEGSHKGLDSENWLCDKQALEIMKLNHLVQQYRHERVELLEKIQELKSQLDGQTSPSSCGQRTPLLDMIPESTKGSDANDATLVGDP